MKWLTASLLLAGSIILFTATAYGQAQGQIAGDNVRVRETPSLESDTNIIFQTSRGEAVEIVDIVGQFYRVNVRDAQGAYIFREFVNVNETVGMLKFDNIPILAAAGAWDEIISTYDTGDAFDVTGRYGSDWYQIRYNGQVGFVERHVLDVSFSNSLVIIRPARGSTANGDMIDELVAYAKSYLGTPYRFGSMDASRGFDCSGFVSVVMRRFDIALQRSSASMAATNGTFVERNALMPGDLVFFATGARGRVSHVGIYIGDDRFIHSATRGGVIISGMGETYYRTRYLRANRVI